MRVPRVLVVGGAVLALAGSAFAADQIAGRDRAPAAATVTIASTAPLFNEQGLVTGQTFERCTVLTNEGPQPADVTLFGSATQADLSPWLGLELVRGTIPDAATTGDCTGFAPDPVDYGSGAVGVVYRGTLASLPDADAGIADPTRWAVGEQHAYLLRIHYTGDNPQQGLTTVQSFSWGATPFDDRPPDPFVDPGTAPPADGGTSSGAGVGGKPITIPIGQQCTVVTFNGRDYIGARAISRPKRIKSRATTTKTTEAKQAKKAQLGSSAADVISSGEQPAALGRREIARREALLQYTRLTGARRLPVLVVRLAPTKNGQIAVRVGLRKNTRLSSPRRWRWVRIRLNGSPAATALKYPFTSVAKMTQLKLGYNQLDLTLDRGAAANRVKGLPRLLRRSFAFVVGQPTSRTPSGSNCTLG